MVYNIQAICLASKQSEDYCAARPISRRDERLQQRPDGLTSAKLIGFDG